MTPLISMEQTDGIVEAVFVAKRHHWVSSMSFAFLQQNYELRKLFYGNNMDPDM